MWSQWEEASDCSKECGGGFKNFTRDVIKSKIEHGFCLGDYWKVEHCNENLCPEDIILIGVVPILIVLLLLAAVCYRRKAKITMEHVSVSMRKLRSLDES